MAETAAITPQLEQQNEKLKAAPQTAQELLEQAQRDTLHKMSGHK